MDNSILRRLTDVALIEYDIRVGLNLGTKHSFVTIMQFRRSYVLER